MKRCPTCGRAFTNNTLINCLNDGAVLVEGVPSPPPYFGAPAAAAPLPSAGVPGTATYTNTPLPAIPELQSPEMQAALKEALDKAGMSGLLNAGSAHSTISVTTGTGTASSTEPTFFAGRTPPPAFTGAPSPAFAGTPPPYAGAVAAPRRKPRGWFSFFLLLVVLLLVLDGLRVLWHQWNPGVPADIVAAVKNADAAEAGAARSLDPRPLASAYDGPALAQEVSRLAALRNARTTVDEQLVSQNFSGYQVSSGGAEAQVDVTETWNTTTYSEPGHTVADQKTGDVTPQTVYLTRKAGGWVVEKIVFHRS